MAIMKCSRELKMRASVHKAITSSMEFALNAAIMKCSRELKMRASVHKAITSSMEFALNADHSKSMIRD